ncbi:MAG: hypothetical protein M1827_004127 [Pycnora praestabilis]|nr:MAG: hypothetical protein M1827_004127 [Pycnora praestabilis]
MYDPTETPLVENMVSPFSMPMKSESSEETSLLHATPAFSMPTFIHARRGKHGRPLPQAIAHRGYKAAHPENTMGAFKGAVEVAAHAIETDIHLTKDGVVVLSHDATLKRCFGKDEKIIDCDWDYISTLRTLKVPHESMPRLKDLLEYIASPGLEHIWLLLDIKLDNDADLVMKLIAETIRSVKASRTPWHERIVLGCWVAKFLPLCTKYLSGFPISHIGFSVWYARQFLKVPNVSFNMLQITLMGPLGQRFLKKTKELKRPMLVWTVNKDDMMKWSIRKEVDGVITDDPKRFLQVCRNWEAGERDTRISWRTVFDIIRINIVVIFFTFLFVRRYRFKLDQRYIKD